MPGAPLRLRITATPSAIPKVREQIGTVAREEGADCLAVQTVVTELVRNAVQHAYPNAEPGLVLVTAELEKGRLVVAVRDDGRGMKPRSKGGRGLGLRMARKLTDEVRVESDERGTTVFATFPVRAVTAS